jgi:hypothetical protein
MEYGSSYHLFNALRGLPNMLIRFMKLSRNQGGKGCNGVLGIVPSGFESQHSAAPGAKGHQVEDTLAIHNVPDVRY